MELKQNKINDIYSSGAVEGYSEELLSRKKCWKKPNNTLRYLEIATPCYSNCSISPRQERQLMVCYKEAMKLPMPQVFFTRGVLK